MKNISRRYIGGFTLVEILVVVLIIGILSAVAVPMYQGAVDKSNFSTMLAPTRSLKEAQEGVRMATGNYTDNAEDLDVTLSQESLSYEFQTRDNGDEFNAIIATNPKLPNVRLARYLDENLLLAGQLHCQAKAGDERANKLCGPLLIGQELNATEDGYISYLLEQEIDKNTCDSINRSWSNNYSKCFKTEKERCIANGMPYEDSSGLCGWVSSGNKVFTGETIKEGGVCKATYYGGCSNSIVESGGLCQTTGRNSECNGAILNGGVCDSVGHGCNNVEINNGGTCRGDYNACIGATINNGGTCESRNSYSCANVIVNDGGKCIAYSEGGYSCRGTYNGTGCCEGINCPDYAPKC